MTPIQQASIARATKNEALLREIRNLEGGFEEINRALDQAADAGDKAEVERLMADIAARKILLTSARRRLDSNKSGITEAEKDAARKENLDAAAAIEVSLQDDVKRAEEIKATIDTLTQQLIAITSKAQPAKARVNHLFRQLPKSMQDRYWSLAQEVGNESTMLGALLEEALLRASIFEKVARSETARLIRQGLPPFVEAYRNRAEKLSSAAHSLAYTVNKGIE